MNLFALRENQESRNESHDVAEDEAVKAQMNILDAWKATNSFLDRWRAGGVLHLADGTELICPVPNVAPNAWLHEIYGPLSKQVIRRLEQSCGHRLNEDIKVFYQLANGLNLFSDSLCLFGLQRMIIREDPMIRQPYSLHTQNLPTERFHGFPDSGVFIGSYSHDGSLLAYNHFEDSTVFRYARNTGDGLEHWQSLADWLNSECKVWSSRNDSNMPH